MKIYKMNFKSIMTTLAIIIGVSFFFASCNNDSNLNNTDDLSYLSLSDNNHWSNMSDTDNLILAKALKRMDIVNTDGIFKTKWTSGSQINISEELYIKIKEVINSSNKSTSKVKSKSPRFKVPPENGDIGSTSYDCLAQAMSSVFGYFGCSTTYNDVNSWAEAQWGTQGVPFNSFFTACDHFLAGGQVTLDANTFSNTFGMPPKGQKVIVVVIIGAECHAGVLSSCLNGNSVFSDATGEHIVKTSEIKMAYQASGCE